MRSVRSRPWFQLGTAAEALPRFVRAASVALLVIVPLIVVPWGTDAYGPVKVVTIYALAGLAVFGWIESFLATGGPKWRFVNLELALWTFVLAVLLSSARSVDARLTLFGAPGRYEGLFAILAYIALFLVGVHFFGSQSGWHTLATASGIAAAATIGYGIGQLFMPPLFAGEAFIREWYAGLGMPRIPSTLGNPVVFGGYLATMIPLLLALAVMHAHRGRVVWLILASLGYVAAGFTLTRAAWLAIAVSTGILVVGSQGRQFRRSVAAAVGCAVLVGAVLLMAVVGSHEPVGQRVASAFDVSTGSSAQRLYIWERTITLIRARPWLGWGLETLRQVFPYDRPALVRLFGVRPVIIDKAHNDILQVAVSVGVPGAVAYAAFWIGAISAAVRLWKRADVSARPLATAWLAAVTAYLIQVQFSFSAVSLAPMVWLLAGAAVGWEAEVTVGQSVPAPTATGDIRQGTAAGHPG